MAHTTAQIWRDYRTKLQGFIHSRVSDPSAAEDILQDVFLRTHSNLKNLKQEQKLQSWIFGIARNAIVDHYRQQRPMEAIPENLQASEEGEAVAHQELVACLEPMIQALPEPYRQALQLAEIEGLPQKELAARENISLSGAKSRVQRGRAMVKEMLLDCCHLEFDQNGKVVDYERNQGACTPKCDSC